MTEWPQCGRDYRSNHDHFEVPRRRPVSTNAAIDSEPRFPRGRAVRVGSRLQSEFNSHISMEGVKPLFDIERTTSTYNKSECER
jgi:hypothetical protein